MCLLLFMQFCDRATAPNVNCFHAICHHANCNYTNLYFANYQPYVTWLSGSLMTRVLYFIIIEKCNACITCFTSVLSCWNILNNYFSTITKFYILIAIETER